MARTRGVYSSSRLLRWQLFKGQTSVVLSVVFGFSPIQKSAESAPDIAKCKAIFANFYRFWFLVVYLTTQLHEDTVTSVRNVNNWSGSVWFTPILGAYIADSFLGRFWTFTISSLIYVLGMGLLTAAVSIKSLKPSCENGVCSKATTMQTTFIYSSLYIIALGAGRTRPNISTFGADQFDDFDSKEKRFKDSFFIWWMFSSFTGVLIATIGIVYIQENYGWGLGYGIPTIGLI